MTRQTNDPADLAEVMRAADNRGRITLDDLTAPEAPAEPEVTAPAYVDMQDAELLAALRDRGTRREALADPAVKVRLAKMDPDLAPELEEWEARAQAAEERAEAAIAASAGPQATPLPGGGAAPSHSPRPMDQQLRAMVKDLQRGTLGE